MAYGDNGYKMRFNSKNFKNPMVAGQQLTNIVMEVSAKEYGMPLDLWPSERFGPLKTPKDVKYHNVCLCFDNRGKAGCIINHGISYDDYIVVTFGSEQSFPFNTNDEVMESIRQACVHYGLVSSDEPLLKPEASTKKGGCYIATAVYGSYDCPQVWTLRRYRDYNLAEHWYGRAFIRLYYAVSPTIVRWFGDKNWFNRLWRRKLDTMVEDLQKSGYSSAPYQDKNW